MNTAKRPCPRSRSPSPNRKKVAPSASSSFSTRPPAQDPATSQSRHRQVATDARKNTTAATMGFSTRPGHGNIKAQPRILTSSQDVALRLSQQNDQLKKELLAAKRELRDAQEEADKNTKTILLLLREKEETKDRHDMLVQRLERRIGLMDSHHKNMTEESEGSASLGTFVLSSDSEDDVFERGVDPPSDSETAGEHRQTMIALKDPPVQGPSGVRTSANQGGRCTSPNAEDAAVKNARARFDLLIAAKYPFPTPAEVRDIAEESWKKSQGISQTPQRPLDSVLNSIVRRGNNFRTHLIRLTVRPKVHQVYGFSSHDGIQKRKKLHDRLVDMDRFIYSDPEHRIGIFENPIVRIILKSILSLARIKSAIGLPEYENIFNPVSFQLIAFILTLVKFCICEWEEGCYQKDSFHVIDHLPIYQELLDALKRWEGEDPERALKLRTSLYKEARNP